MDEELWTLEEVVNRLPAVASAEFARVFGPAGLGANCIPQTYAGIEVLKYFGIEAVPWPCELRAQWGELVVILGQGAAPDASRVTYSGHLVAVAPGLSAMLDLSLGQLRKKWAVPVPDAAWFDWPENLTPGLRLEGATVVPVFKINDVSLMYRPHPDPRAYRRQDFTRGRVVRLAQPMIGNLIRLLRHEAPRHRLGVRIEYSLPGRIGCPITHAPGSSVQSLRRWCGRPTGRRS